MSDVAIRVENLSKRYRIDQEATAHYDTLRDRVSNFVKAPFHWVMDGKPKKKKENHFIWALEEVSFEVNKGDVVGIIGRNGAGKSTLLKILSRITEPTTGRAIVYGRVGSLLEVGMGFHPELSGRENVTLNGAILGMKKAEIDRKFDEIIAFAELEKFVDTPVKFYSSGMYVRLAFAVAAHLEPDILLVDEVLAVGDAPFQKKCLGKMGDVAKEGRTVFFVSHNIGAIRLLCRGGILFEEGKMVLEGEVDEVLERYSVLTEALASKRGGFFRPREDATRRLSVESVEVEVPKTFGQDFLITVNYSVHSRVERFSVEWYIKDMYGQRIVTGLSALSNGVWFSPSNGTMGELQCRVSQWRFPGGSYTLSVMLCIPFVECMDFVEDAIHFTVPDMMPGHSGFVFARKYGWLIPESSWESGSGTTLVEIK